ncbi:trans-aconitate 2-methyltransferase [Phaeacidiphilus oryzae]|uniref:trans-aconitate 2-methyltransferase n=1 Tax=Phaeacidiphilus oryzae TaxID=348818 RepID=UPI0007C7CD4C|nr:trans-aconitate 2-methyltransferase [Phaeacidiphilus oryzae]
MSSPLSASWDPHQYLRHGGHRTRPFADLLARIPAEKPRRVVDLGCGPGNSTQLVRARWPEARVLGLDNSPEMLRKARQTAGAGLEFDYADAAEYVPEAGEVDVLVSNALLQWVPGHADLLPGWVAALPPGGVLAFQVPGNFGAPSHAILRELRTSPRWADRLAEGADRVSAVLEPADYLERLLDLGCEADVWETTYLHLLQGEDPVLDWVKGTALRPVLTALADDPAATREFLDEYAARLAEAYPAGPHGTVLPFRRIFAVAVKAGPTASGPTDSGPTVSDSTDGETRA